LLRGTMHEYQSARVVSLIQDNMRELWIVECNDLSTILSNAPRNLIKAMHMKVSCQGEKLPPQ
jgi:hypothetical protein